MDSNIDLENRPNQFVEFTLKYDGPSVQNGSMAIEDVIAALDGFSSAYNRIAALQDPTREHRIRVSDIRHSSFAVVLVAWVVVNQKELLPIAYDASKAVISTIFSLISGIVATKGEVPKGITINGNNNSVVLNMGDGDTQVEMSKGTYELYKKKTVDSSLEKIASPLKTGSVESLRLTALEDGETTEEIILGVAERPYFATLEENTTTSVSTELEGSFVSLNKDSNRGTFRLMNGKTASYRFVGSEAQVEAMHADFSHSGPVRVGCVGVFDSNLELKSLEVSQITRLQRSLFDNEQTMNASGE